jgi:CRISPR-associated protein (TIGR02710 family)
MPDNAVTTVDLPPELREVQARWLAASRAEQERIYAAEFGPAFAPLFAKLPLHGAPPGFAHPTVLISVLGFSWQPVALLAAWVKPHHMLVLGTRESLLQCPGGEPVIPLIARVAGLERESIETREVPDAGETEIYHEVLAFLERHGVDRRNATNVAVDPTGGKKSMSVAAGLAAYLANARMLYVDYGEYDTAKRIPVAGTEYPRLLANPLEVFGDLEIERVREAFNRGDYDEAHRLAKHLADRMDQRREPDTLALVADGYGAWSRFQFQNGVDALRSARDDAKRFATRGGWRWAPAFLKLVDAHVDALGTLVGVAERPASLEAGLPMVCNHLAAAHRTLETGRVSQALLLTYAAIERYVGLCLWILFGLDNDAPDYDRIGEQLDPDRYHECGKKLCGRNYERRELEGKLQYTNGLQLLAALKPDLIRLEDLGPLKGIAEKRNHCEFEHGFVPRVPDAVQVNGFLARAEEIVQRTCGDLSTRLDALRFPKL